MHPVLPLLMKPMRPTILSLPAMRPSILLEILLWHVI